MALAAEFSIGGRPIGPGHPCYVIAEIGANHDRDWEVATALVDHAVEAGADAAKFQTYSGAAIYSTRMPRFSHLDRDPAAYLEEISLPREWQPRLDAYCRERGIHFFSSPFDHDAVAELDALDVPVLKIASPEIVDLPLIRACAATRRPLIVSTGMATLGDVEEALEAAEDAGAMHVALMQCTSAYPTAPEHVNLRAMETLRAAFGVPVGLSDHTLGTAVPAAAAALGADFLEKHVTLDRRRDGPDHPFAIEPPELTAMVRGIREAEAALGDGRKPGRQRGEPEETFRLARRSLVTTRDLPAGTALERDMLTAKRPGYGIRPRDLDVVLGRALRRDVSADEVLTWEMV